jgi:hypothetical protein
VSPFQISGHDVVFSWLSSQPNAECRRVFLDWLAAVVDDPTGRGTKIPGVLSPIYLAIVPLGQKDTAVVRYLVSDQFHAVRILTIGPLP